MPLYLYQAAYTPESWAAQLKNPQNRVEAVGRQACEAVGGKLVGSWYCFGGCWIVADGNNRVGLILKKNSEATIADIPERLVATAQFGEWDDETMDWWNPCPKSFREVMGNLCIEKRDLRYHREK